jgi:hypothetical protein
MNARPARVTAVVPKIEKNPYPRVIVFKMDNRIPTTKGDAMTTRGKRPPVTMRVRITNTVATTLFREDTPSFCKIESGL